MKLKQALIIGFSSAILATSAIAAEPAANLKGAKTMKPMTMEMPATSKEAIHHRKGQKKVSLESKTDAQAKDNAKLDELNKLNPAAEKDQTEKNSIKS